MYQNTQYNNALIKSLGLIVDSALKIPSKLSAAYFLRGQVLQTHNQKKNKRKRKQTKQLASYLTGFQFPPCNTHHYIYICKELHSSHKPEHINTYPQEPKWTTFSRVRPSTALPSCGFFTKTKKRGCCVVGIRGLAGPLKPTLLGGKTGLCDKDTHIKGCTNETQVGPPQIKVIQKIKKGKCAILRLE